jgi:Zn-dependent protease
MRDELHVGRIGGVRIGLHWSLLATVVLLAVGLAGSRFSNDAPGYSRTSYVVAGILTSVGLLVGVLLHELGHAFVARRRGLTVDGITLSWMGGVTRIEGETGSATTELLVAGVGPLTSAAVGGLAFAAREAVSAGGGGSLLLACLGWLAWINVLLAAFNILPAAPLDGGRVLHALVWFAGRDRWKATRIAAGAGIVVGGLIVVLGLVVTERTSDLFNGLIIGFMGWWMVASARAELAGAALRRAFSGVRMADVMRPVGEAPGWITVRSFMEQYGGRRPGWVWLLKDWQGGYSGIALGDAVAAVPYPQWDMSRPQDVAMPLSAAGPSTPQDDPLDALARASDRRLLLVISEGQTLGAVLPSDVEAMVRLGGPPLRGGTRPAPGPAR